MGGVACVSEPKASADGVRGCVAGSKNPGGSHQRPPEPDGVLVGENVRSDGATGHELHQALVEKTPLVLPVEAAAVFPPPQQLPPAHDQEPVAQDLLVNSLQNEWVGHRIWLDQGEGELERLGASQDRRHVTSVTSGG